MSDSLKCPGLVYSDFGIDLALEMMELSVYRDRHPHSLNRGQRQRLAVASILSMELDIIMLDEPTTGQDRGHLNKFLARMKKLNEAGKTIILISHDMGVVAEYASRTIVKKGGRDIPVLLRSGGTGAVFSFKFIFKSDKNTYPLQI